MRAPGTARRPPADADSGPHSDAGALTGSEPDPEPSPAARQRGAPPSRSPAPSSVSRTGGVPPARTPGTARGSPWAPGRPAASRCRTTRWRSTSSPRPSPVSQLQPGDLVFWGTTSSPTSIYHVALYVGNDQIIHAPRTGRPVSEESMYYWISPTFFARP
ncbi:MAG: NlpC/P60 family protein [Nocardioides sp.]